MTRPYRVIQYKTNGKTPSDEIADLLDLDVDVMPLAVELNALLDGKGLLGPYFNPPMTSEITIYALTAGQYHVLYSHHSKRHEICVLLFVKGPAKNALRSAELRVRQLYQF